MKTNIKSLFNLTFAGLIALGMFVFIGCDKGNTPGMGNLEVRLHDAPVDYEEVNVFIERVEVNNTTGDQGWRVISEPNRLYNILELVNGEFEVLADVSLEEGTYPQIRLILSTDGHSVVIDGEEHSMFVPSGAQTGIKLNVNINIVEGEDYTLLLDFDAQRSVVKTGNAPSPGYILQPVIRASNLAETGNIGGVIEPFQARAVIYAIAGSDTLSTTYADEENGSFLLVGLNVGTYSVSAVPRTEGFSGTIIPDVSVIKGETSDLGIIVLDSDE
jgi:hypothetical protein